MLQLLRAFAWLRWRILLNSFDRTSARDAVERFSLAIEKLGPILAAVILAPSALALGAGAAIVSYALAAGLEYGTFFQAVRFGLLVLAAMTIIGPLVMPAADRTNPVRMLLLPIPRRTLYVVQVGGALADPWVLLGVPILIGVPIGFAAAGAWIGAVAAVLAGVLLAGVFTGLSMLSTTVMHLVARDRRRGELLALIFVVVVPMVALLPTMFANQGDRQREIGMPQVPEGLRGIFEGALGLLPTEVYTRAARSALEGDGGAVAMALLALSVAVGLLHAAGFAIYGRLLDSPQTTGATRTGQMNEVWTRRLPLLSEGASAVALAHLRLAMRTPRGRAVLLTPLLMFGIFSLFMWRGGGVLEFGSMTFKSGISMASFVAAMSLLSILPIAMNQFAIDRAGLTMVLLSPLSVRDYLAGKAAGNAIVTGISTSVVVLVSVLLFPTGSPWTWVSLALGLAATWIAVAPVAAIVSAIFPRAVDLNSVGRGSNAHSAAGLLGMLAFVLAGGPAVALAIVADRVLGRPALGALLILAWMLVAIAVNSVLSRVAERTFEARRENIARLIG